MFYTIPQDLANTKSERETAVKRTSELKLEFFGHSYTTTCVWYWTCYFNLLNLLSYWAFLRFELMRSKQICKPKFYTSVRYYNTLLNYFNLPRWQCIFLLYFPSRINLSFFNKIQERKIKTDRTSKERIILKIEITHL